jgi:hypothetical protein
MIISFEQWVKIQHLLCFVGVEVWGKTGQELNEMAESLREEIEKQNKPGSENE